MNVNRAQLVGPVFVAAMVLSAAALEVLFGAARAVFYALLPAVATVGVLTFISAPEKPRA
jgi:hypothetical protein